ARVLRPARALAGRAGRQLTAPGMDAASLGPLTVSRLCLGTMLMGGKTPAGDAHRMLDMFAAAGGTFVDTADTYGDGESERTLAPWLARRRDHVVVATKVRFPVSDPGGSGLAPERIAKADDGPLRRGGATGGARLPWGRLGAGFLSGRYSREAEPPPGSRLGDASDDVEEAPFRRAIERNFRAVDETAAVAAELGATVAQVAIAWLLHQPDVAAPIIGPRTPEQLEDVLGAAKV